MSWLSSALDSLTGSSGKETTKQKPASWDSIGQGSEAIWDAAIDLIHGNATGNSLQQMIAQDTAAKKAASDAYLSEMSGLDSNLISTLTGLTDKYNTDTSSYLGDYTDKIGNYETKMNTPAFYLNMGGNNVGVQTGGTRSAIQQLTDMADTLYGNQISNAENQYTKGSTLADTTYGVGSNAAERTQEAAQTYTPNAAALSTLEKLWDMGMQMQGLRFSLPSTTTTGEYTPSVLQSISDLMSTATDTAALFAGG